MKMLGLAGSLIVFGAATLSLRADEGMWLFSAPPREQLKAK